MCGVGSDATYGSIMLQELGVFCPGVPCGSQVLAERPCMQAEFGLDGEDNPSICTHSPALPHTVSQMLSLGRFWKTEMYLLVRRNQNLPPVGSQVLGQDFTWPG